MPGYLPCPMERIMVAAVRPGRLALLLLGLLVSLAGHTQAQPVLPRIAHAGGQVDGATYTNSLEALDENYGAGFRAFEIDFSFTADRELVCLHDWEESFTRSFGLPPVGPLTLAAFERLVRERSDFTKCTLATFMQWFDNHTDTYLITDVKDDNIAALQRISSNYPQSLSRIIPQIYQPAEYQAVKDLGYERLIWTLYLYPGGTQSVLAAIGEMSLWALTMNSDRAQQQLPRLLAELGIPTYAHTINHYGDLLYLQSQGIDEIYTDSLSPARELEIAAGLGMSEPDSPLRRARDVRENEATRSIRQFFNLPTVHFALSGEFDPSQLETNQLSGLDQTNGIIEAEATGSDPYIVFSPLPGPAEAPQIYLDVDSPDDTLLEIFYTTREEPMFAASRRVSQRVTAGNNKVVIPISNASVITRLRLDPGTVPGTYRIRNFEVRSDSRSLYRDLLRFFRRH